LVLIVGVLGGMMFEACLWEKVGKLEKNFWLGSWLGCFEKWKKLNGDFEIECGKIFELYVKKNGHVI